MNVAALSLPAFRLPETRRLPVAIGLSLALHGLLLAMHFKFPEASRNLRERALDIILVNAKSARKPGDAQVLAQANLDGGGNTDEDRRAKTPLPPTPQQTAGNDIEQMQRRVRELEAQQQQMLTQARSLRSSPSLQNGQDQPLPSHANGFDLAESAKAMARLEGEINKSLDEYSKRPRKKNIGARAEEYRFAQYREDWRQKVERVGTLNYPEAARGKLYGTLVLSVTINSDGTIANIVIDRPSEHRVLNEAARRIVQMSGPYSPFPPDIRRDFDQIEFTATWSFTRSDSLETKPQ